MYSFINLFTLNILIPFKAHFMNVFTNLSEILNFTYFTKDSSHYPYYTIHSTLHCSKGKKPEHSRFDCPMPTSAFFFYYFFTDLGLHLSSLRFFCAKISHKSIGLFFFFLLIYVKIIVML